MCILINYLDIVEMTSPETIKFATNSRDIQDYISGIKSQRGERFRQTLSTLQTQRSLTEDKEQDNDDMGDEEENGRYCLHRNF